MGFQLQINEYGYGIRHVQMACMWLTMCALFMSRSSLGVAILAMTDTTRRNDTNVEIYEWDKNTQGLILSSFFWGYMVMQIPAGLLAKHYGGKLILMVALLASGVITLVTPLVASWGGWACVCACRVAMGLTQACLFPASHTLLGRWLPATERTALAGIVYGGFQIGTIVSMPISGMLAETFLGWKMIFYCISGLMLLTAGVWGALAASSPAEHRLISAEEREYIEAALNTTPANNARAVPWRHILRTVPLYAIMMSHVGSSIAFIMFFVDLPTYLEHAMQISLKNSAILSGMPYAGMWVGSLFATSLSEKLCNKGLLSAKACRKTFNSIGLFGTAGGMTVLAFIDTDHKSFAVFTLIVTLTLQGFMAAGFMVNHLDLSPQFAGVMLSLTNFVATLIGMLTPLTTSFILNNDPSDVSRWRIVFLLVASILVFCNIVYVILGDAARQPWDAADYDDQLTAGLGLFGTAGGMTVLAFIDTDHKSFAVFTLIVTLTLQGFMAAGFMVNHLDLSPQFAGVMLSLTNFVATLIGMLTPLTTSFILNNDPSDVSRWRIVFLLVASILVFCNIVYVILGDAARQPWDAADYDDQLTAGLDEIKPVLAQHENNSKPIKE